MKDFIKADIIINKFVLATFVERGLGNAYHKHRPTHGLVINASTCTKTYIFDSGKRVTVGQNEILYLPKGSTYRVQTDSSGDCFAINFDIEGNAEFSPMCYTPKNAHAFLKAFEKARMLWKNKIGNYRMRCISILYEILLMIQSECATEYVAKSTAALIEPAVQYIHSNYTDGELKISDLAQLCGISEDYFRKIFRKKYNVSPSGYISSLKIEYAKELLRSGLLSVSEIAELAGFGSVSYFSREFKKTVGISPSEYK